MIHIMPLVYYFSMQSLSLCIFKDFESYFTIFIAITCGMRTSLTIVVYVVLGAAIIYVDAFQALLRVVNVSVNVCLNAYVHKHFRDA